jgi:hypothetical protein
MSIECNSWHLIMFLLIADVLANSCMNLCLYQRILTCKNTCCTVLFGSCGLVFFFGLWVQPISVPQPKVFAPKKRPTNLYKPILPISNYAPIPNNWRNPSSLPVLQLLVLGVLQQHRCQWLNGVSLATSPVIIWYPTWLWLTVRHGFSMALIEIDGWPII